MIRRTWLVYGVLLVVWAVVLIWQVLEHNWVQRAAETALINRAKDISNTAGLVMRSQRRFGSVISRDRIESALNDLLKFGDISGIALFSSAGKMRGSTVRLMESGVAVCFCRSSEKVSHHELPHRSGASDASVQAWGRWAKPMRG